MPAQIRSFAPSDLEGCHCLLTANGWAHRIADQAYLERLIGASQRVMVAVADDQIVGFARAITDGLSNGYISMVVVAPSHRGAGHRAQLGRRLDWREQRNNLDAAGGTLPGFGIFCEVGFCFVR